MQTQRCTRGLERTPRLTISQRYGRYFEKFLPLLDSLLRPLQDEFDIMG